MGTNASKMLSIDGHAVQAPNPFSSAQLSWAFAIAGTHLPVIAIYEIRDSDNRKSTVTRHFVRRLSIIASILLSCVQKALSGPARNLNGSQNTNYRTESFRSFQLLAQINLISTAVDVGGTRFALKEYGQLLGTFLVSTYLLVWTLVSASFVLLHRLLESS